MLQLLMIMNYSRRIIGFLRVNCIFIRFLTLDPTQPVPPKTENFVTQPDQTRPEPTRCLTRSVFKSSVPAALLASPVNF